MGSRSGTTFPRSKVPKSVQQVIERDRQCWFARKELGYQPDHTHEGRSDASPSMIRLRRIVSGRHPQCQREKLHRSSKLSFTDTIGISLRRVDPSLTGTDIF